ncbi:MAG: inositol monophosphatase family protein [Actinomycetes bacterium]
MPARSDRAAEAGHSSDPAALLALARDVAHRAGRLLVERRPPGALAVTSKSTPTDIVTAMDTAAERLIVQALRAARPGDPVLGEEGTPGADADADTEPGAHPGGVRWVVDPIDGTVNYFYGIPAYAVSIAAEVDGEVVAGVVHNPVSGETWTATRGGGARLDDDPVTVNEPVPLDRALVGTGFAYAAERRARQAGILLTALPAVRDIRRAGAASLDLCAVACGRLDGYYEQGLAPWDLAAGGLVAREAGARVEGAYGKPAGEDLVIAAPPGVFEPLHDLVAPLFSA